jgi:hypothetical protein
MRGDRELFDKYTSDSTRARSPLFCLHKAALRGSLTAWRAILSCPSLFGLPSEVLSIPSLDPDLLFGFGTCVFSRSLLCTAPSTSFHFRFLSRLLFLSGPSCSLLIPVSAFPHRLRGANILHVCSLVSKICYLDMWSATKDIATAMLTFPFLHATAKARGRELFAASREGIVMTVGVVVGVALVISRERLTGSLVIARTNTRSLWKYFSDSSVMNVQRNSTSVL